MKTLKQLAQEALDVQNACNLSGVAHSFARAMTDLADHGIHGDARNTHPISVLWADKIAHLTRTQDPARALCVFEAFNTVMDLAEGKAA